MRVVDAIQREAVGSWTGEKGVGGWSPGETVGGRRPREAVGGWRAERRQLRLDKREANREVGVEERRGSQHQTPSREARRQDRVQ